MAPAFLVFALLLQGQKKLVRDTSRDLSRGKFFFQRDCAACHSIGPNDRIAPDLLGVTQRRDHDWLIHMIQRPELLLNQQDPIAVALLMRYKIRMPDQRVDDAERDSLIRYIEAQTAAYEKKTARTGKNGKVGSGNPRK
jgi:protein SCO1/2